MTWFEEKQPYKCKINLICHEACLSMMSQWKKHIKTNFALLLFGYLVMYLFLQ